MFVRVHTFMCVHVCVEGEGVVAVVVEGGCMCLHVCMHVVAHACVCLCLYDCVHVCMSQVLIVFI